MGVGNLTELTDADTTGINALLFGIISELGINNVLATEVSPHARRAIKEADVSRRMMHAAKRESSLPRDLTSDLLVSHERRPFPDSAEDIATLALNIKDPNYRIKVAEQGIYMFNRDGLMHASDPFDFYPQLDLKDDTGHAFYLGAELAKAQVAWQLGKRYNQDEELLWGCATTVEEQDITQQKKQGTTMTTGRKCGTAE
jgi:dihydropteroate synthase-like protein